MKKLMMVVGLVVSMVAFGEIQIIDGVKYECKDGMCMPVEDEDTVPSMSPSTGADTEIIAGENKSAVTTPVREDTDGTVPPSPAAIAQGYMKADAFIAFLRNEKSDDPL